jgi:hypothetical protein
MHVARPARVALLGLLTSSLVLGGLDGVAAAQTLKTVSPTSAGNDKTYTFTLTGDSFLPADQEEVVLKPNPAITGQADLPGTVADNTEACGGVLVPLPDSDCGTSLTFTVNTTNAAPGTYDVVETQTPLGGTAATSTLAKGVTIFSQPTFAATTPIAPAVRGQGATTAIKVTGTGFADGIQADFGDGTTTTAVTVAKATELTATVTVAKDAAVGVRDVVLTAADGVHSRTQAGGFTIAQAPAIEGVSPESLKAGESVKGAVIRGQRFVSGGDFAVTIAGVTVTNPVVAADGTTITADLAAASGARGGPRTVFVTNADGGTANLLSAFTVLAPPAMPASVKAAPGDGKATVSWRAPSDPGSSAITSYTVSASEVSVPPVKVSGTTLTATVNGLTNGTAYTFSVVAENGVGPGPAGVSTSVTPKVGIVMSGALSKRQSVAGERITVSGRLVRASDKAPISGATLALRFTPQVGTPSSRNVRTGTDGRWSTTVAPSYTLRIAATYAGDSTTSGGTITNTLPVATRITVSSPRNGSRSSISSPLVVTGTTGPNKAGKVVGIYRLANGNSTLLGRATVQSNGTYRFSVRLGRGDHVVRVGLGPTTGNRAGASVMVVVKRR